LWFQPLAKIPGQPLRVKDYVARQIVRDIAEVINVFFRDDEKLTWIDLAQRHERHDPVIFVNDAGVCLSLNYFAEDTVLVHRALSTP
jgi:hypothetical protein